MTQKYQGDISLLSGSEIEKAAQNKKFAPLKGQIVIAEGEATGHKHLLVADPQAKIEIAQDENGYFIRVLKGSAVLTHDIHDTLTLPVGTHFLGRQWEYDEIKERPVRD